MDLDEYDASVLCMVAAASGWQWSPRFENLRDPDLAAARRLGLRVVVWTESEPEAMTAFRDRRVAGIIADYPDRLRAVMAARGMALLPAYD